PVASAVVRGRLLGFGRRLVRVGWRDLCDPERCLDDVVRNVLLGLVRHADLLRRLVVALVGAAGGCQAVGSVLTTASAPRRARISARGLGPRTSSTPEKVSAPARPRGRDSGSVLTRRSGSLRAVRAARSGVKVRP